MTAGTLTIDGRKFRVVSEKDFQTMRAALRQQQRRAAEDRADVEVSQKRLSDPREKRVAWSAVKKRAGLA
jgi:hypothetical protein